MGSNNKPKQLKGSKMTLVITNAVNLGHLWHEPKIGAIAMLTWLMLTT